jgi:hypothetical protein
LPALELFTGVIESKVPPTRVVAIQGVRSLMLAADSKAPAIPDDEQIDLAQVTEALRKGE